MSSLTKLLLVPSCFLFRSMFYFFFESRGSKDDPVVIWLTGGPGCSSELALFYENGPFTIADNMSLLWNDHGWDKVMLLFCLLSHLFFFLFLRFVNLILSAFKCAYSSEWRSSQNRVVASSSRYFSQNSFTTLNNLFSCLSVEISAIWQCHVVFALLAIRFETNWMARVDFGVESAEQAKIHGLSSIQLKGKNLSQILWKY